MTAWIKSSHSSGDGGACVEMLLTSALVSIRDSKNPDGPLFDVSPTAWHAFLRTVTHPKG